MTGIDDERLARLRLAASMPYRPSSCRKLVERFGSAVEALSRPSAEWAPIIGVRSEEAEAFFEAGRRFDAAKELLELDRIGARLLWPGLEGFPPALEAIPDPPALLWVLGKLAERPALAIVGTRGPSPYGRRMAARLAGEAAKAGLTVVSGLARGVDTEAHLATLAAGGATWAVLGSGLLHPYPAENAPLIKRIADSGGAVISEHALRTEPFKENFPRRNRLISGLSFGTLVIEGALQSGALITAKCALEQGREVFAVPGPADSELSRGPHQLIQQGAKLAGAIEDIVQEMTLFNSLPAPAPQEPPHRELLAALGPESRSFDELAETIGWEPAKLSEALTEMELLGFVGGLPGRRYYRK